MPDGKTLHLHSPPYQPEHPRSITCVGAGRLKTIPNSFGTGDGGIAQRQLPPPAGESGLSGLSASWWYWSQQRSQIRQELTVLYILFISVHFYNIAYIGQAKETNLTS